MGFYSQVSYVQKTFYRFLIAGRPFEFQNIFSKDTQGLLQVFMRRERFTGLPCPEDLLQVFFGQKTFYRSSLSGRPFTGLLLSEDLQQTVYGQWTFSRSLTGLLSPEDLLKSFMCYEWKIFIFVFFSASFVLIENIQNQAIPSKIL